MLIFFRRLHNSAPQATGTNRLEFLLEQVDEEEAAAAEGIISADETDDDDEEGDELNERVQPDPLPTTSATPRSILSPEQLLKQTKRRDLRAKRRAEKKRESEWERALAQVRSCLTKLHRRTHCVICIFYHTQRLNPQMI